MAREYGLCTYREDMEGSGQPDWMLSKRGRRYLNERELREMIEALAREK